MLDLIMPHIQIRNQEAERRWINTDNIESVTELPSVPEVHIEMNSRASHILRGKEALRFLDDYQRLCVAHERPEVG